jgi:hypothetical protein
LSCRIEDEERAQLLGIVQIQAFGTRYSGEVGKEGARSAVELRVEVLSKKQPAL